MHNFAWDFRPMPKFRKTNDRIPRKFPERRKDRQTDPILLDPFIGVQKEYFHQLSIFIIVEG